MKPKTGFGPGAAAVVAVLVVACGGEGARGGVPPADSGFAGVQRRGAMVMGVDQYTSTHVFEPLADGGRISLQRNEADSAGIGRIRRHMDDIAGRFAGGDFRLPGIVHARSVPGTDVMAARRAGIRYTVELLPRGAALRLTSTDPAAVAAIHAFLAFQRQDHHAAAHADS